MWHKLRYNFIKKHYSHQLFFYLCFRRTSSKCCPAWRENSPSTWWCIITQPQPQKPVVAASKRFLCSRAHLATIPPRLAEWPLRVKNLYMAVELVLEAIHIYHPVHPLLDPCCPRIASIASEVIIWGTVQFIVTTMSLPMRNRYT